MANYLLIDKGVLNGFLMGNVSLKLEKLNKENRILFKEDYFSTPSRPWEVRYDNAYPNVIYDKKEQVYRCYYTLIVYDPESSKTLLDERKNKTYHPKDNRITALCYAESSDGKIWEKPDLGLIEFEGSTANNILMLYAHGTGVFLDSEEMNPEKRYKLITKVDYSANNHYMAVAFSKDGIHFGNLIPWPKYNPQADTHNFVFRDKNTGSYVLITRIWKNSVRIPAIAISHDFINWSEPAEMMRGQGFENQIYSMPVFQYGGLYFGLASVYHEGDFTAEDYDTVDCKLKYATTLDGWDDVCPDECFIERGEGSYPNGAFDCGCIYASPPVEIDNMLYFYYMGGNGRHTNYRETSFARGCLDKNRFAYYEVKNPDQEGFLQTKSFDFYGKQLRLLADIEKDGSILVELTTPNGKTVMEGFENGTVQKGTGGYWDVIFPGSPQGPPAGKNAAIRIRFKKARIYAIDGDISLVKHKY